jgi:hypothetical protein
MFRGPATPPTLAFVWSRTSEFFSLFLLSVGFGLDAPKQPAFLTFCDRNEKQKHPVRHLVIRK